MSDGSRPMNPPLAYAAALQYRCNCGVALTGQHVGHPLSGLSLGPGRGVRRNYIKRREHKLCTASR